LLEQQELRVEKLRRGLAVDDRDRAQRSSRARAPPLGQKHRDEPRLDRRGFRARVRQSRYVFAAGRLLRARERVQHRTARVRVDLDEAWTVGRDVEVEAVENAERWLLDGGDGRGCVQCGRDIARQRGHAIDRFHELPHLGGVVSVDEHRRIGKQVRMRFLERRRQLRAKRGLKPAAHDRNIRDRAITFPIEGVGCRPARAHPATIGPSRAGINPGSGTAIELQRRIAMCCAFVSPSAASSNAS
jgi:hypothetical protein